MKVYFTVLLLLIFVSLEFRELEGQTLKETMSCQTSSTQNIKIFAALLSKEDISTDGEISVLKLKIKLRFINENIEPTLVYTGRVSVSHFWISKSVEKAQKKEFEISTSVSELTENNIAVNNLSLKDFTSISSEHTYNTETIVHIYFKKENVKSGKYILQLNIDTWLWNDKESELILPKFTPYGKILRTPIITEPIPLIVE